MFLALKNSRYMQYVAALAATLTMTSAACHIAWPSPTLPLLTSNDSPIGITITDEEGSWIVSIFTLVSIPFTFLAGWSMEKFGRKFTLLISVIPLAIPWIIIIFATSSTILYIARALAGIGLSIATVVSSIYNAEISDNDIRGRLGTIFMLMKMSGNVLVLSIGPFVSYKVLSIVCLTIPLAFFVIFIFMPESPYYLVKIGKIEEAKNVVHRITSIEKDNDFVDKKIEDIRILIENDMKNKSNIWELFANVEYRKPLLITIGIKSLQQLSGLAAIEPYMQTIIESSNSSITPEISSIIFGIVPIPAVLLTGLFVDKLGRKPILIVSALGCAVALIGEGVYFYIQDFLNSNTDTITWLPTTGLIIYLFMKPLGIATIPYVLVAELFPTNVKSLATSASFFYGLSLATLLGKFFKPVSDAIGIYNSFWAFAVCCLLGSIFVFFVLPETKGKSFAEIQKKLNRNRKVVRNGRV